MSTAGVVGSTGLVGGSILSTLYNDASFTKVYAYTRKDLPQNVKLNAIKSTDTATWSALYPKDNEVFFSGLGTTKAIAGGLENQRKIDLDLNLELAKAAKAAGTKTYVLISSASANSSSMLPYVKMKGQLEDEVQKLGFEHCIILRPGLLLGNRQQSRLAEGMVQGIAKTMNTISGKLIDFWAQDAVVVARAAVAASQQVESDKKVWFLEQSEIVKLGRTEWK